MQMALRRAVWKTSACASFRNPEAPPGGPRSHPVPVRQPLAACCAGSWGRCSLVVPIGLPISGGGGGGALSITLPDMEPYATAHVTIEVTIEREM